MGDHTITMTDDQEDIFKEMGIRDFGLDASITAKDVLDFIVSSNSESKRHEKADAQWRAMGIVEKENRLKLTVPTGP